MKRALMLQNILAKMDIVRVAWYSAFFNVLSEATQDDIISRTEQAL